MKAKYINKKCDWCLENWYHEKENIIRTCDFHQKYSFARCLKKIKAEKRARLKWRIVYGIFLAIVIFGLILGTSIFFVWPRINDYHQAETVVLLIKCLIALPLLIWMMVDNEKTAHKWIKEYEKEAAEWEQIKEPKTRTQPLTK